MESLRIHDAAPGVYRLRGLSPTVYLDLRTPSAPAFLLIPNEGSNAMDFDRRWERLGRVMSDGPGGVAEGIVQVGVRHRLERSAGPSERPWVRTAELQSIERLDDQEESRLLAEFPPDPSADPQEPLVTPRFAEDILTHADELTERFGAFEPRREGADREMAASHRAALLATAVYDFGQLSQLRGVIPSDVESWGKRNAARLLSVRHAGRTLLPAFQFDGTGQLREHVGQINALLGADPMMDEWSRWAWWWSRTSYLSGQAPLDLADSDYERVLHAAHRMTRQNRAIEDARLLREQWPADDLDELVEWTAAQSEVTSPEERQRRIEKASDEVVTEWGGVLRRLGEE